VGQALGRFALRRRGNRVPVSRCLEVSQASKPTATLVTMVVRTQTSTQGTTMVLVTRMPTIGTGARTRQGSPVVRSRPERSLAALKILRHHLMAVQSPNLARPGR
jgi:hypothetical protein